MAAHDYHRPGDGFVHVSLRRSAEAVLAARRLAKWWFVPAGTMRPIPYGQALSHAEVADILRGGGRCVLKVTSWEDTDGEDGPAGVRVRYHYNDALHWPGSPNCNTVLLSSTAFDMPVVAEFE